MRQRIGRGRGAVPVGELALPPPQPSAFNIIARVHRSSSLPPLRFCINRVPRLAPLLPATGHSQNLPFSCRFEPRILELVWRIWSEIAGGSRRVAVFLHSVKWVCRFYPFGEVGRSPT